MELRDGGWIGIKGDHFDQPAQAGLHHDLPRALRHDHEGAENPGDVLVDCQNLFRLFAGFLQRRLNAAFPREAFADDF